MEKRTERNKELYAKINNEIREIEYVTNNEAFKDTNDVLSSVNPDLFDGKKKEKEEVKKSKGSNNKVFIGAMVVLAIVVLIIVVVAVINNGK